MNIIDLECSRCGATIEPDLAKGIGVCEYCGHQCAEVSEVFGELKYSADESRGFEPVIETEALEALS